MGGLEVSALLMRFGNHQHKAPLHYTLSGLDDVYLISGYEIEDTEDGPVLSVHDVDGLRRAIGKYLATEKKVLNGKEIRFLRKELDLTQAELAGLLRIGDQQVARWEKGLCEMPGPADGLLRFIYLEEIGASGFSVRELLKDLEEFDAPVQDAQLFAVTATGWTHRHAA